jgi:hypothetical protein
MYISDLNFMCMCGTMSWKFGTFIDAFLLTTTELSFTSLVCADICELCLCYSGCCNIVIIVFPEFSSVNMCTRMQRSLQRSTVVLLLVARQSRFGSNESNEYQTNKNIMLSPTVQANKETNQVRFS